jgi:hypothetical protein
LIGKSTDWKIQKKLFLLKNVFVHSYVRHSLHLDPEIKLFVIVWISWLFFLGSVDQIIFVKTSKLQYELYSGNS